MKLDPVERMLNPTREVPEKTKETGLVHFACGKCRKSFPLFSLKLHVEQCRDALNDIAQRMNDNV